MYYIHPAPLNPLTVEWFGEPHPNGVVCEAICTHKVSTNS